MGVKEFTKSGKFVAIVFALVVLLVPFGIEQIGEVTDLYRFPVMKTVTGLFAGPPPAVKASVVRSVDWDRYRRDLEAFSAWAEGQEGAVISLPREPVVIRVKEAEKRQERKMWAVPVASCTAGGSAGREKGYVFISGFDGPFDEGSVISPSPDLCGYEIVCIGERSVWFRAILESEGYVPMGIVKFPEFARTEGESLVRGSRKYVARDAFPLTSGGWLMLDSFVPPDGVVFKILDENRRAVATILCIVIDEKGGK